MTLIFFLSFFAALFASQKEDTYVFNFQRSQLSATSESHSTIEERRARVSIGFVYDVNGIGRTGQTIGAWYHVYGSWAGQVSLNYFSSRQPTLPFLDRQTMGLYYGASYIMKEHLMRDGWALKPRLTAGLSSFSGRYPSHSLMLGAEALFQKEKLGIIGSYRTSPDRISLVSLSGSWSF